MTKILVSACLLGAPVRHDGGDRRLSDPRRQRRRMEGRLMGPWDAATTGGNPGPARHGGFSEAEIDALEEAIAIG